MARMVAIAILKQGSEPHHIYQEGILNSCCLYRLLPLLDGAEKLVWKHASTCIDQYAEDMSV